LVDPACGRHPTALWKVRIARGGGSTACAGGLPAAGASHSTNYCARRRRRIAPNVLMPPSNNRPSAPAGVMQDYWQRHMAEK